MDTLGDFLKAFEIDDALEYRDAIFMAGRKQFVRLALTKQDRDRESLTVEAERLLDPRLDLGRGVHAGERVPLTIDEAFHLLCSPSGPTPSDPVLNFGEFEFQHDA